MLKVHIEPSRVTPQQVGVRWRDDRAEGGVLQSTTTAGRHGGPAAWVAMIRGTFDGGMSDCVRVRPARGCLLWLRSNVAYPPEPSFGDQPC